MLYSEEWDLEKLNSKANQILIDLEKEGKCSFKSFNGSIKLPTSSNRESAKHIMIICSGYPENAGVWAYSLLEESERKSDKLAKTTMAPYFEELPDHVRIVVLNPHEGELISPPEASIETYIFQLNQVLEYFKNSDVSFMLLGFSLGGDVILRFLSQYPQFIGKISKLIFIDPTPPSLGRRKLKPELLELVDNALFYGLSDLDGNPGEFAEFTKMRLKIKPELVPCESHGEMPNLILSRLCEELKNLQA